MTLFIGYLTAIPFNSENAFMFSGYCYLKELRYAIILMIIVDSLYTLIILLLDFTPNSTPLPHKLVMQQLRSSPVYKLYPVRYHSTNSWQLQEV